MNLKYIQQTDMAWHGSYYTMYEEVRLFSHPGVSDNFIYSLRPAVFTHGTLLRLINRYDQTRLHSTVRFFEGTRRLYGTKRKKNNGRLNERKMKKNNQKKRKRLRRGQRYRP